MRYKVVHYRPQFLHIISDSDSALFHTTKANSEQGLLSSKRPKKHNNSTKNVIHMTSKSLEAIMKLHTAIQNVSITLVLI